MFIFNKADVDIPDGAFTLLDWFILTIGRKTFTTFGGNQKFILKVLFLVWVSLQNVGKFHLFHQFHLDTVDPPTSDILLSNHNPDVYLQKVRNYLKLTLIFLSALTLSCHYWRVATLLMLMITMYDKKGDRVPSLFFS